MSNARLTVMMAACILCVPMQAVLIAAPPSGATTTPAERIVKFKYLRVDLNRRTVTIDAKVCLRKGQLELLLCRSGFNKEHESVFSTEAMPSQLHAALLALGLTPGKPAEWIMDDTDSEGRFIPPRGGGVTVAVQWRDKAGKMRRLAAADFLVVDAKDKSARTDRWIFVGSDILPGGRYWGDQEGYIISVANFASSVLDIPFESSDQDTQLSFSANTEVIPPMGTAVEVIITPLAGAEKSPHARATLTIGPDGQLSVEGRDVSPEGLTEWAEKFTSLHNKAQVVIAPHPRALIADVAKARTQLRIGGVYFFAQRWYGENYPVVPRTSRQAVAAMKEWRDKFAKPQDYIRDPGPQAREELARLRAEIAKLDQQRNRVELHIEQLQKALSLYKSPPLDTLIEKQPDK